MSHSVVQRAFVLFALLVLGASASQAQTTDAEVLLPDRFAFSPDVAYDEAVPSPAAFLGYELGTAFTPHYRVADYLQALAGASDRVAIEPYGQTHEGRTLYLVTVTAPAHHARLEEIRQRNLRLATGEALPEAAAEALIDEQPAVVWLSYNVHGNEASSSEAAMQVAYRLAAGQDAATQQILDGTVVLLDPMLNPDGRERYVQWYNSMQRDVLSTDPYDLEHDEPWPGGRTNKYWFDLNRDWVWLVHPESQGRLAAYQRWLPQVHVDYHEQGYNSNYFTMPGTTPRNLNLPDAYEGWTDVFGRAHIAAFDEHRVSYATREAFDFFYPGYGSSYPSNLGAIGMLTEQGGHSRGGRAVETEDGYVLTLRQRVFDHYTTSIATLEAAAERREELLRYFRTFFSEAADKHPDVAAYVLADDGGRGYTYDVVSMLMAHGVRVERATEDVRLRNAHGYWDGEAADRTFAEGAFLIPADQPRHVFLHTVMQRQMAIEDSVMYDMATWSAPLAYNLDAAWTGTMPDVETTTLDLPPAPPAGVSGLGAQYAYVIDWRQRHAPKALAQLWRLGYRVRAAREGFSDGTQAFGPGTLIVLLGRNEERLGRVEDDMRRVSRETGVQIVGMDTGRMETGIDLASRDSRPVEAPKVALMVDAPFSSYTAGQLWYLFDQWTGLPVSRIRTDALDGLPLDEYDVLVLPGAWGGLSSHLDSTQVERLRTWVQQGGTLVATEGSAAFLTKERSGLTGIELAQAPEAEEEDEEAGPEPVAYTRYEAREDTVGLRRIPGSAFRGHLDTSHPLAAGMPDHLYSLVFGDDALEPSERLHAVGYYDRDPATVLASGYASEENREKLAGKVFAGVQPMGRGQVVLLTDNTQYRMFWVGPARLMQNAVMLVPGLL